MDKSFNKILKENCNNNLTIETKIVKNEFKENYMLQI